MSGQYKTTPQVVDAFQWSGEPGPLPDWLMAEIPKRAMIVGFNDDPACYLMIGDNHVYTTKVSPTDWIIKRDDGTINVCEAALFAAIYEPVVERAI